MKRIAKNEMYVKMLDSNGVIFGVMFTKKDGSIRKMSCRLRVTKGVTGKGRRYHPVTKGLIGVYDMNNGFRMVNLKTIKECQFNGTRFEVDQSTKVFDF